MLSSILTFFIIGLIVLVGISIVLTLVGVAFGLAIGLVKFLLFVIAPVALLGYVALRFFAPRSHRLSKADREWLES